MQLIYNSNRPIFNYATFIKSEFDNYNYFSSGKSCIDYLCKYYNLKNKKIIIPSYICTDVIEVLQYNQCKIIFADVDIEDLNILFYLFIYNNPEYYIIDEYFNMKYSSDINELFIRFRETMDNFGFNNFNVNSYNLLGFLNYHLYIDSESDMDYYDDINIDEELLIDDIKI